MFRNALLVAAIAEAATGVALVIAPSLVGELLLGEALAGVAASVARVAGLALIGLGLACWPGPPRLGMLAFSVAVAVGLRCISAAQGGCTGVATLVSWDSLLFGSVLFLHDEDLTSGLE